MHIYEYLGGERAETPVAAVAMLKEIDQDSAPAFKRVVWNTAPGTLADGTCKWESKAEEPRAG